MSAPLKVGIRTRLDEPPAFEVEASLIEGGLATTKMGGRWNITHVATGFSVSGRIDMENQEIAERLLRGLLVIADWSRIDGRNTGFSPEVMATINAEIDHWVKEDEALEQAKRAGEEDDEVECPICHGDGVVSRGDL